MTEKLLVTFLGDLQVKGAIIDTNLLLLLLFGLFDLQQIGKHRLVRKYEVEDFERLTELVAQFENRLHITTNILTEICNLSDNYNRTQEFTFFEFIKNLFSPYHETAIQSSYLINQNETPYIKFGLTDATIVDLAKQHVLVITDDFPLYHYLSSEQHPVINFTHLKNY